MKFFNSKALTLCALVTLPVAVYAQNGANPNGSGANAISTVVSFLNIAPDSRSGAMGDAGVALSPDVNANYWNPAKLAFLENNHDLSLSYSPWLRQLVPDVSLAYLSYAHKIDERNSLGLSLRYFNLGSIQLIDQQQVDQGTYRPSEFSLDGSFARKFGNNLSLGLTLRYIYSNYSNGSFGGSSAIQSNAGHAVSAGVSMYYTKPYGNNAIFSFGTNISNIGSKISYSDVGPSYFLPANLKIGAANTWLLDDVNKFTVTFDINKLLVPTPRFDSNGNRISDDGVSVPSGIFKSFGDAPGGFSEEFKEITFSPGAEYWYNDLFALRAGYFYENPAKGGRHYATMGLGVKYDVFKFDFSYLAASQKNSPLANTLRFTLSASFGGTTNADKK
ncbi:type IX secretion system outer membrane channel protein PorV [Mucilaginibacter pallidiroseus]|uniref:Type IX secretion system outer membrane channel protein PorV n=1 Tax=Mucilaginibacter pallidiroseus TaxID=2599295 RepID=A0A563UG39_9SPHI|nr:type IX secretion system outer membrane channel protein PorV [Mucilaginibacter pallidiroseus]TWR30321.1 type IX secretion system outer membrane channel protein PorV [Mucilaginibacter pallidiroseus]